MVEAVRLKDHHKEMIRVKTIEINKKLVMAEKIPWRPQDLVHKAIEEIRYMDVDTSREKLVFKSQEDE